MTVTTVATAPCTTFTTGGSALPAAEPRPPGLHLRDFCLRYPGQPVLSGLNLDVESGKWTCLLGVSGCGKTSLLQHIAQLGASLSPVAALTRRTWPAQTTGHLGTDDGQPLMQRVAWMAQSDMLLPWLDVAGNIALGATLRGEATRPQRVGRILAGVHLSEYATRLPHTLSGGMRQRVALARCLYENRPLNLMDEPFSRLDAITRHAMQNLAATLLRSRTVLFVTHDPLEAIRLAHRLFVLSGCPVSARELLLPGHPPRDVTAVGIATLVQALLDELSTQRAGPTSSSSAGQAGRAVNRPSD